MAFGCLSLISCFEVEQEFTLNPDGTGKVVLDCVVQNFSLDGNSEPSEENLKKSVATLIKDSKGVDAWRDITYAWTDDGRIKFKGTAYFSDISKLKFSNIGILTFDWSVKDGNGSLTMDFNESEDGGEKKLASKDLELRKKEIVAERQKFKQSKPMLSGFMAGLQHKAVFNLPGKEGTTTNFAEEKDGKLSVEVTGEKLLAAMDKLVNDDAWLIANSFDPQEGPSNVESMSEELFGKQGPVKAERTGLGKPLFDYATEVATAQKDFAKLQEKFTDPITPPATGEAMKSLEIVGVQMSDEIDEKLGFKAEIVGIKDGWEKGETKEMEIKLGLDSDAVKSLILIDGVKRTELNKRGSSSFGGGPTTFTFESENGFPENGKLLVVVHDGVKTFKVSFKFEGISLLGKAVKVR